MGKPWRLLGSLLLAGLCFSQVGFAKKLEHVKYVPISKKLKFAPKTELPRVSAQTEKQLLEAGYQPIGVVSVVLREYHCAKKHECEALNGELDATRLAREKAAQYGADAISLWSDNQDFVRSRGPTGFAKLKAPKNCTRRPDYSGPIQPGQTKYKVDCAVEADYVSRTLFVESRAISWHKSASDKGWENTKKAVEQLNKLYRKTHNRSYRRAIGFGYEEPDSKSDPPRKIKLSKRDRRDNIDLDSDLPAGLTAARTGDLEAVRAGIAAGSLLTEKTAAGNTAAHYAAAAGHGEVLRLLVQHQTAVAPRNRHGVTPLYLAARYGRREAVGVLLDAGADINDQSLNFMDLTATMAAAKYGHGEVLNNLLERGADIARKDKEGKDILSHAVAAGHNALIAPLLQRYSGQERSDVLKATLYMAVSANNAGAVTLLLEQGADIDTRYTLGISRVYTPLLLAVVENYPETVNVLLKAGADPNAGTSVGSPLALNLKVRGNTGRDAMDGNTAVAMALVRAGAKVDDRRITKKIFVPKVGQSSGHEQLISYLLEGGRLGSASLAELYKSAVRAGRLDYMEQIGDIAGGDPVDLRDPRLLHGAIGSQSVETVEFLLNRGAPLDAELNRHQETPLILAAKYGDRDMVALLLTRGADATRVNSQGKTAYDMAYDSGNLRIVKAMAGAAISEQASSE